MSKLTAMFGQTTSLTDHTAIHGQHEITLTTQERCCGQRDNRPSVVCCYLLLSSHSLLFIVVRVLIKGMLCVPPCRSSPVDRVVGS